MSGEEAASDPGLQVERTLLAWRRTALAVAVLSAAGMRFTLELIGWSAVVIGSAGVGFGLLAYVSAQRRYRRLRRVFGPNQPLAGNGLSQAALALATIALGVGALGYLAAASG